MIALADRPDGRAKLDEFDDKLARLIAAADEQIGNSERFSALDHIDVFQSGLVAYGGDGLQITEDGWLLLRALGIARQEASDSDYAATLQSLNLIDDLIGPEARLKMFESEARSIEQNADLVAPRETPDPEPPLAGSWPTEPEVPNESGDRLLDIGPTATSSDISAPRDDAEIASAAPAFLIRKFAAGTSSPSPRPRPLSRLKTRMQQGLNIWRRHLQQDQSPKITRRSGLNLERGVFVLLSLLVVVGGAGAIAALKQVRSLKSEITTLQRELLPLRERVAKFDQTERAKETPGKVSDQKIPPSREPRAEQAALVLSREEIQIVRDYIKPAPVVGAPTAPISVGDPVGGPTIPFPSAVTEKVPKLLGARFAIRSGSIIIVRKDSRQADAVIGPN